MIDITILYETLLDVNPLILLKNDRLDDYFWKLKFQHDYKFIPENINTNWRRHYSKVLIGSLLIKYLKTFSTYSFIELLDNWDYYELIVSGDPGTSLKIYHSGEMVTSNYIIGNILLEAQDVIFQALYKFIVSEIK